MVLHQGKSVSLVTIFVAISFAVTNVIAAPTCGPKDYAALVRGTRAYTKAELIDAHLHQTFTTVEENLSWMHAAKNSVRKDHLLFGDIEFSVLGDVNRLTNDKNLATSLANKHKDLLMTELKSLRQSLMTKHPDSIEDVLFYSDFKSVRFAIVPRTKPLSLVTSRADLRQKLPHGLQKELTAMFARVNAEYSELVKVSGLNVDGKVENWFRGGIGHTADEANFAARTSRDMGSEATGNQLQNFENRRIQVALNTYRKWGESMRQVDLVPDPAMKPLLDGSFVKDDVLDIVKKSANAGEARARLKAKYGAELTETQADRLITYNQVIDIFSPGIHVAERKVASLEAAALGGLSADFSGLGAKNRGATARAIANGKSVGQAIALVRKGEQAVTKEFDQSKSDFAKIINRYVESSVSSGDDFVGVVKTQWTPTAKRQLVDEVAQLKSPSAQRLAFISDGVVASERNLLAAHGEAIEKVLRQELEGKISMEKLKQVTFAIDMFGKAAGKGDVGLLMGEGNAAALSTADRATVREAFERAVTVFNKKPDRELALKTYRTVF
ncbi:hypothetical protein BH10BDE1_BH10BDE1_19070 [soil metagenome]